MSAESGASSSSQDAAAPLIVLRRSGEDAASQERCPAPVLRRCRGDSIFGDRLRGVGREPCRCDGLRRDRGAHVVAAAEHASVRAAGGFATEAAVLVVRARASRSVLERPAGRGLGAYARCRRTAGGPRMMLTIRSMVAGGFVFCTIDCTGCIAQRLTKAEVAFDAPRTFRWRVNAAVAEVIEQRMRALV